MIIVITGLTGSGKTLLATRLMRKEWKLGAKIFVNYQVAFDAENTNINRWHQLDELYHLNNGLIGIDEGQKLFDARRWASLPVSFAEKIAQHRKHHIDIITTTQDLAHIDVRIRQNIHTLYHCFSLFRYPQNDRVKPIFQLIKIIRKARTINADSERINWQKDGRQKFMFVSRFWTKEYYNTYADIGFNRFLCRIKFQDKKWIAKIYSRDLVNQGKARL